MNIERERQIHIHDPNIVCFQLTVCEQLTHLAFKATLMPHNYLVILLTNWINPRGPQDSEVSRDLSNKTSCTQNRCAHGSERSGTAAFWNRCVQGTAIGQPSDMGRGPWDPRASCVLWVLAHDIMALGTWHGHRQQVKICNSQEASLARVAWPG